MKTIRLASLTALISSVIQVDGADADELSPGTAFDEQLAAAQLDISDDPELMADAKEFAKNAETGLGKKVSAIARAPSKPDGKTEPAKTAQGHRLGDKPLRKRDIKL